MPELSLVVSSGDCSLVAACRLLIVVASLVAERGLQGAPQHVRSSWIRDLTRIPLHWEVDSSPLNHQGSPVSAKSYILPSLPS